MRDVRHLAPAVQVRTERPDHWTEIAACAEHQHPDMWYSAAPHNQDRAKEVCSNCPIRERCLDWGLTHEKHGIWGGVDIATAPRRSAA